MLLARRELRDQAQAGEVVVAPREEVEQIAHGADAQLLELGRGRTLHTLEDRHRRVDVLLDRWRPLATRLGRRLRRRRAAGERGERAVQPATALRRRKAAIAA